METLKSYEVGEGYEGHLSLAILKDKEAGMEKFFYVEEGEEWHCEGFLERHKLFLGVPLGRYDHINNKAHERILKAIVMLNLGEEINLENLLVNHQN
jgi:hypothetical protein